MYDIWMFVIASDIESGNKENLSWNVFPDFFNIESLKK